MIERVKGMMVYAGASWVLWLLLAVSVISVAIVIDRARIFWSQKDSLASLVLDLHRLLGEGNRKGAEARLTRSPNAESEVVLAGLTQWENGKTAAQEAMAAATGLARARLERRLLFLGTVGNNAPFVGLLGTVIGVLGAFDALGQTGLASDGGGLAPERVMATIAESLVATAIGLLVAIPSVLVFNYFKALSAAAVANAETLGHVLLTHMENPRSEATDDDGGQ